MIIKSSIKLKIKESLKTHTIDDIITEFKRLIKMKDKGADNDNKLGAENCRNKVHPDNFLSSHTMGYMTAKKLKSNLKMSPSLKILNP